MCYTADLCLNPALVQNSLTYATRVRTIKNEVTKMESNKEMLKVHPHLLPLEDQATQYLYFQCCISLFVTHKNKK